MVTLRRQCSSRLARPSCLPKCSVWSRRTTVACSTVATAMARPGHRMGMHATSVSLLVLINNRYTTTHANFYSNGPFSSASMSTQHSPDWSKPGQPYYAQSNGYAQPQNNDFGGYQNGYSHFDASQQ